MDRPDYRYSWDLISCKRSDLTVQRASHMWSGRHWQNAGRHQQASTGSASGSCVVLVCSCVVPAPPVLSLRWDRVLTAIVPRLKLFQQALKTGPRHSNEQTRKVRVKVRFRFSLLPLSLSLPLPLAVVVLISQSFSVPNFWMEYGVQSMKDGHARAAPILCTRPWTDFVRSTPYRASQPVSQPASYSRRFLPRTS